MEEFIILLKCAPIDDLISLFDLIEGTDYTIIDKDDVKAYKLLNSASFNASLCTELIKDINIFIPAAKAYLSDFILCKKNPSKDIMKYINYMSLEYLFIPYLSDQRIKKITNKLRKS